MKIELIHTKDLQAPGTWGSAHEFKMLPIWLDVQPLKRAMSETSFQLHLCLDQQDTSHSNVFEYFVPDLNEAVYLLWGFMCEPSPVGRQLLVLLGNSSHPLSNTKVRLIVKWECEGDHIMGDHNALGNTAAHSATGSNNLRTKEASKCSHFPICFCLVHSMLFLHTLLQSLLKSETT